VPNKSKKGAFPRFQASIGLNYLQELLYSCRSQIDNIYLPYCAIGLNKDSEIGRSGMVKMVRDARDVSKLLKPLSQSLIPSAAVTIVALLVVAYGIAHIGFSMEYMRANPSLKNLPLWEYIAKGGDLNLWLYYTYGSYWIIFTTSAVAALLTSYLIFKPYLERR
jgi:hypothetical protein